MDKKETIEQMAKAGFESMFCDKWEDLTVNSIDRSIWIQIAKDMLKAIRFPSELCHICRDMHLKQDDRF